MARLERKLDSAAGPVQALACELRKLRIEAGSPTYRTLARKAGYSATTLSEAAGGLRKPTLEVLLAYVGACGGDLVEWRRRWHEVPSVAQPVAQPSAEPPAPARPANRRRWLLYLGAGVGVGATAVALGLAVVPIGLGRHAPNAAAGGVPCPAVPRDAAFTGITYGGGAHVRSGASRDDPVLRTIPAGCTVGFAGYCIGQKVVDDTALLPDTRWFEVPGGGVVASGVIHGNPPASLAPSRCLHGRSAPQSVELAVRAAGGGTFELSVTGTDLQIVGFTASAQADPDVPGGRAWRQVAFAQAVDGRFTASLPPALLGAAPPGGPIIVVAAACLGGDGPTEVIDAATAPAGDPALTDEQLGIAARSACQYPSRG